MSVRHFNGNCERFQSQTTNVILIDFYRWKRTCYYMKIHYVSFLLLYWWCCWSLRHIFSTSCSKQNPKFAYFHICTASLIVLHWYRFWLIDFWCFNAIFSYIMTRPVLVLEEAGENHGQATGKLYRLRLLVHPFLSFTKPCANPRHIGDRLVC
jgi:hypothetical protein